jgi:hypothetical protein
MEIKSAFKKYGLRYYSTLVCSEKCSACNDILDFFDDQSWNDFIFFFFFLWSGSDDQNNNSIALGDILKSLYLFFPFFLVLNILRFPFFFCYFFLALYASDVTSKKQQ